MESMRRLGSVRKVVLLDFDQTLAATHVWRLLEGRKDPSLLEGVTDDRIWGSEERLRLVRRWWTDLADIGVDVHVVSHNWKPVIEAALSRAGLPTSSVHGRETVLQKGASVSRILAKSSTRATAACFVDDDPANIRDVRATCPGITTLLCPPQGLQECHTEALLQWCKEG